MSIRTMTGDDWPQVWPFFDEIVEAGETYAYPLDLTSEQAQALWTMSPPGQTYSVRIARNGASYPLKCGRAPP